MAIREAEGVHGMGCSCITSAQGRHPHAYPHTFTRTLTHTLTLTLQHACTRAFSTPLLRPDVLLSLDYTPQFSHAPAACLLHVCCAQECPTSGLLWAEDIKMTPRPAQRRRAGDALRKCDNDPHVLLQVRGCMCVLVPCAMHHKPDGRGGGRERGESGCWGAVCETSVTYQSIPKGRTVMPLNH